MNKRKIRLGVGVSVALLIVTTVSLSVLAILTYLEGYNSLQLTNRSITMMQQYDHAVLESEQLLQKLHEGLDKEALQAAEHAQSLGGKQVGEAWQFTFDAGAGRALCLTVKGIEQGMCVVVSRTLNGNADAITPGDTLTLYQGNRKD